MDDLRPEDMIGVKKRYEYKGDNDFLLGVDAGGPLYIYHPKIWEDIHENRWIVVAMGGSLALPYQVVEMHQLSVPRSFTVRHIHGSFRDFKTAADHACEELIRAHERWKGRKEGRVYSWDHYGAMSHLYKELQTLPDYPEDNIR